MVVLLPDSASKYLSKIFDENWMREHGFLEPAVAKGTAEDVMRRKRRGGVITADRGSQIRDVIRLMTEDGVSQVPVTDGGRLVGIVAETDLMRHLLTNKGKPEDPIDGLVESNFASVEPGTSIDMLTEILGQGKVCIVLDGDEIAGIITKIDLINLLATERAS